MIRAAFVAGCSVPEGIKIDDVRSYLEGLPHVTEVHDLHIWAMSTTETALTAHLVIPEIADHDGLLARCCGDLHDRSGLSTRSCNLNVATKHIRVLAR